MTAGVGTASPRAQPRPADRPVPGAARGWVVAAAAAWAVLFVDVVRVWLPSVLHLAGGPAGSRSPALLSLLALVSVLAPLPAIVWFRRVPPAATWLGGLCGLAAARGILQVLDGGPPQLVVSAVGVAAGVLALAALAAGVPSGHLARLGVLVGLAISAGQHAALGTWDLVWRPGVVATTAAALLVTGAVVAAFRGRTVPLWWPTPLGECGELAAVWTRGPAWPWLVVGPVLALLGTLVAVPARLEMAAGLRPGAATLATVGAGGLAVLAVLAARRGGGPLAGGVGATLVVLGTVLALRPVDATAAAGQLVILAGCGAVIGALGRMPGDSGPRRRAVAAVGSLAGFWLLTVAYFASYEVSTGLNNRVWLVVAAGWVAALGGAAAWTGRGLSADRRPIARSGATVVAVTVVLGVAGAALTPDPSLTDATPTVVAGEVRVATFNVRSGFGADGRFDPDAIAASLRAENVDVVVLNEVDRGWLIEGGHDLLRLLAVRLDLPHAAFAPAADVVWGNAVLSRVPLSEVRTERLPRGDVPMQRSWVSATLELDDGARVAVIGTQFHGAPSGAQIRLAQARSVAAEAARLTGRGLPVAVLGDLGAPPDAPELEPLSFLDDVAPDLPSSRTELDITRRTDRILASEELRPRGLRVPATTAGGARPVIVTLVLDR